MNYRDRLLLLATQYSAATNLSTARVATLVHNQGAFFKRLEDGAGCTVDTYEKCLQWFSDHWPEGLAWPENVLRPMPRQAA